jgi:hypothetical protein
LITEFGHDPLGRTVWTARRWAEDATPSPGLDRESETEFDRAGRVTKTRVLEGTSPWAETEFGHDDDGLQRWMEDAEGNRTNYEYSDLGRLDRMLYPQADGVRQTKTYAYRKDGKPTEIQLRAAEADTAVRVRAPLLQEPCI